MMKDRYITEHQETKPRRAEARYAYYRRCQVFRKGGEQCKAPAEKGSHICYAHAGQMAMAVRRERERRAVLEAAVAQMRKKGRPECEMADLFMDFKGINVTLAVMAQALIDGRIDCKTAGRLVVQLQTVSKLLWMMHRKGREVCKENHVLPQICADERGLGKEKTSTTKDTRSTSLLQAQYPSGQAAKQEWHRNLPLINAADTDLRDLEPRRTAEARRGGEEKKRLPLVNTDNTDPRKTGEPAGAERHRAGNEREQTRSALVAKILAVANRRGWSHAPPELLRAA